MDKTTTPAPPPVRPSSQEAAPLKFRRVRTPTLLQMEAVECGAAALGIVLGYHGKYVPLEELRTSCGVSRDGSKAKNVLAAARKYGLEAKGFKIGDTEDLRRRPLPLIVFWNFNHFLVVEGFSKKQVYLNDPATGPRTVSHAVFEESFTGVALIMEPRADFAKGGNKKGVLGSLRRRLGGNGKALLYVVLVSGLLVIPGLVIPVFSKVFVDEYLIGHRLGWIRALLAGMLITAILRAGLTFLQQHFLLRFELKLALGASSRFFWHVLRLPIVFFTQRFSGEIGSRVVINDMVAQLLSSQLATTILGFVTMAFYGVAMFQYSISLTLLTVGIAGLNLLALQMISRRRADANQRLMQEEGKLIGTTMSGVQMIESLKATGSESDFFARWAGFQAKELNAQQSLGRPTQFLVVLPRVLTSINQAAVLGFGGFLVMKGTLTVGTLVAFQSLMSSFIEPVNGLVTLGNTLQTVQGGMSRLDDVLSYPVDPQTGDAPIPEESRRLTKLSGTLELKEVTFGYSRLDEPLIEKFSLLLKPGERVALVGPTGCGKSTISKLVSGLYPAWSGDVLFDGKKREDLPRHVLSNSVALVDQEIFLFEGTIRENITLWDKTAPESSLIQAAKDAYIHEDITSRQCGYDSFVQESGRNFSGGQRQRLEIARALLNNPTILVLDEATSALDSKTEKMIDQNLRRRGCTCLIIAHRLSTIRDCDEIIVMERGRIVQRGTHDQLAGQPGLYADLIRN
ncbi:MAG: transporter related [Verrucomicrobiales bacterium]|nr:transporter related [Verrucomicrobiales bacterium]